MNLALTSVRISSPAVELDRQIQIGNDDDCVASRAQPYIDPLLLGVEEGDMLEVVGNEVGAEAGVDYVQDVAVELVGYALRVVVGRFEHPAVLDQVGPQ